MCPDYPCVGFNSRVLGFFWFPWKNLCRLSRAQVSLIYSAALLSLTGAVLVGYKIYPLINVPALAGLSCLLAAIGNMD